MESSQEHIQIICMKDLPWLEWSLGVSCKRDLDFVEYLVLNSKEMVKVYLSTLYNMKEGKSTFKTRQPRGAMTIAAVGALAGSFTFGVLTELFKEKNR